MEENNTNNKVVNEVFDPKDIEENKTMAILAYIIFFIPYLAAKDSKYAMYHAKQGLVLFLVYLAGYVVLQILWSLFPFSLWSLLSMLDILWGVGILVLAILGIVNASQGKAEKLPIIGDLVKKFKL